jgi:hypothetical protein
MNPCHFEGDVDGVRHICNQPSGHSRPHLFELFKRDEAREMETHTIPPPTPLFAWTSTEQMGHTIDGRAKVRIMVIEPQIVALSTRGPSDPSKLTTYERHLLEHIYTTLGHLYATLERTRALEARIAELERAARVAAKEARK